MKYFYLLIMFGFCINIAYSLPSGGQLNGTVVDETGHAVAGAAVVIIQTGQGTVTGGKGQFSLSVQQAGDYHVRVSAIGYKPFFTKLKLKADHPTRLAVTLERETTELSEVSILGSRYNPDNLIDLQRTPMPSTVITRRQIELMGSRRLDEVLKEQTGLAIVNDIGAGSRAVGLQMQGFDSGYTMILIDGQPMTGRNSGNFDLSRVSIANIERIEIIKGASSCLFGSEAMAGVVNIVTRQRISQRQAMAQLRYGSFKMLDASLEAESPFADGRGAAYISGNHYRTDGFNANPYLEEGKTVPPYTSSTVQGRLKYTLNDVNSINLTGRYATRNSDNNKSYSEDQTLDRLGEDDLNMSVVLNSNLEKGLRLKSQYYITRYATEQSVTDLNSGRVSPRNAFSQYLHRGELQGAKIWSNTFTLTCGLGTQYETMTDMVYTGGKQQYNSFLYSQADWKFSNRAGLIGGARLEYNSRYGASLTPSAGLSYQLTKSLLAKAAVSTGFKTPDFRQLYMVFTNFAGGGYTVLGTASFDAELQKLIDAGEIASVSDNARRVGSLEPERSVSYSLSMAYSSGAKFRMDVNGFYNNVSNFISAEPVALRKNGQQILSYYNIDRVFLSGGELALSWKTSRRLTVSAGYQLLYAKDRSVVDSIKAGTGVYSKVYNSNTGESRRSRGSDYFGLTNRSRHMANLRFAYEHEPGGITASFRVNYRGKYGFMEAGNRNDFLDPYDTYVPDYFLFNVSLQKSFYNKRLTLQLTADNLFGYRDMKIPAQAGRAILAGITYRFFD